MEKKVERDYVVIVSGVPRSGTSMMIKAIGAGGIELVVDIWATR